MNIRADLTTAPEATFRFRKARLDLADCFDWLGRRESRSIHAVITDPPYGLLEYTPDEQRKLATGSGGVWRIPPSFDGHRRSPLPRFTTLTLNDLKRLRDFYSEFVVALSRVLVPGAHVFVATNALLLPHVAASCGVSDLEYRGVVSRLVMTMRGGDRPKNAHEEFADVTVMPRSMHEPWLLMRKPLEGRVQDNLRKWKTGGLRRVSSDQPFGDVIKSHPTGPIEKKIAPHPSLKPQSFMRRLAAASLPFGEGVILDPFAGSGSTLAAAEAMGLESVGVEKDRAYFDLATVALPRLAALKCPDTAKTS